MRLDRLRAEEQALADGLVGTPLGHEGQHLPFPLGEFLDGVAGAPPADQLGALLTTVAGLWIRRRWGLAASLVAAGMLMLSTVMCPVSGHHTGVGGWWVIQLGCALGLVATSILAWRRATPQQDTPTDPIDGAASPVQAGSPTRTCQLPCCSRPSRLNVLIRTARRCQPAGRCRSGSRRVGCHHLRAGLVLHWWSAISGLPTPRRCGRRLAVAPGRHHRRPDDQRDQGRWLLGNSHPSMTVSGSRAAPAA
jgi:hypothetical protein